MKRKNSIRFTAAILAAAMLFTGCGGENAQTPPEVTTDGTTTAEVVTEATEATTEAVESTEATTEAEATTAPDVKVEMPDVTGKPSYQAAGALIALGIEFSVNESYSDEVTSGTVIAQSVSAGTMLSKDQSVVITISKGNKPAPEWTETAVKEKTMYVSESCYSRKKALQGAQTVKKYDVNDKVVVIATTNTQYSKLDDGTFIHNDFLSDTKVTLAPSSNGYDWVINPTYKYDDISVLADPSDVPTASVELYDASVSYGNEFNDNPVYLNGAYCVRNGELYGLTDLKGNLLMDIEYDFIAIVFGIIEARKNYINYTLDTNLKVCESNVFGHGWGGSTPLAYDEDKELFARIEEDPALGYYLADFYSKRQFEEYFGDDFTVVQAATIDEANNSVICEEGGLGLFANGSLVVPMEHEAIFCDDFRVVAHKNGKIYVYDENGKCYTKGVYDNKSNTGQDCYFLNNYLTVCKNGKWGLIDAKGNEVVSCQFEDITSVCDGKAWAKYNGKWGVIKLK